MIQEKRSTAFAFYTLKGQGLVKLKFGLFVIINYISKIHLINTQWDAQHILVQYTNTQFNPIKSTPFILGGSHKSSELTYAFNYSHFTQEDGLKERWQYFYCIVLERSLWLLPWSIHLFTYIYRLYNSKGEETNKT